MRGRYGQCFLTMQRLLKVLIILLGLDACSNNKTTSDLKTLDFGAFTIETPKEWTKVQEQGIDSYVGRIAMDRIDTLEFDLGWYSNDLTEYQEIKMGNGKTYYINAYDTAYSPTLVDSANKDIVVKSNIAWDTIDGKRAKIISPIKLGNGTTGIYIDSLWNAGSSIDKFNLYGTNLKPQNTKAALIV
jgi:hypothetical protein